MLKKGLVMADPSTAEVRLFSKQRTENTRNTIADDALVTDEIRLRPYREAALGGILAVNAAGRIVFMNGHTEQMFGYPRSEVIGQNLMELAPKRVHEDYMAALHAYFEAPSVRMLGLEMDLVARRKNGEEFLVEVGVSFVVGRRGRSRWGSSPMLPTASAAATN
jgi:PAS domain S-box-containing protein